METFGVLSLAKWGNSLAIRLPKKILDSQVVRISHGKKWGINALGQIVKIDAEIYILF